MAGSEVISKIAPQLLTLVYCLRMPGKSEGICIGWFPKATVLLPGIVTQAELNCQQDDLAWLASTVLAGNTSSKAAAVLKDWKRQSTTCHWFPRILVEKAVSEALAQLFCGHVSIGLLKRRVCI